MPTWWGGLGEYVSGAESWPGLGVESVHVSAARGCSRRCTFCYLNSHNLGRGLKVVSPAVLLEGCNRLRAKWGVEGFYFVDDCLLDRNSRQSDALLQCLIREGDGFRFGCDVQIQELEDVSFLRRVYRAGFRSLYVGVESASPRVRKVLGKGRIVDSIEKCLATALGMGFFIRASIGIGWPDESESEIAATLDLIRNVPALLFDAFRYTPLPGVPLTSYWARSSARFDNGDDFLSPFADYSEFGGNYSSLDDRKFEAYWAEMRWLEKERRMRFLPSHQG
jgi:radical SAM superfamily enzyme YgiQ (UPF0313 family)